MPLIPLKKLTLYPPFLSLSLVSPDLVDLLNEITGQSRFV